MAIQGITSIKQEHHQSSTDVTFKNACNEKPDIRRRTFGPDRFLLFSYFKKTYNEVKHHRQGLKSDLMR